MHPMPPMQYRSLGKSPLRVSALCLGTMMFADQTDLAEARNILAHAREHGVNFIDTADIYSMGRCESLLGELFKDGSRRDWVLASKLGNRMGTEPNQSHYSRPWVERPCQDSPRPLATGPPALHSTPRAYNRIDIEHPLPAAASPPRPRTPPATRVPTLPLGGAAAGGLQALGP